MKTIYTLLLAFGLCFTVHAQNNLKVFPSESDNVDYNLNTIELEEFNDIVFGASHSLIFDETVTSVFEDKGEIRKISFKNMNNISNFNFSNFDLSNVMVLEIFYSEGDIINIPSSVFNNIPTLKYIYIKSYHTLTDSIINNILHETIYQLNNVKIVYQILENS